MNKKQLLGLILFSITSFLIISCNEPESGEEKSFLPAKNVKIEDDLTRKNYTDLNINLRDPNGTITDTFGVNQNFIKDLSIDAAIMTILRIPSIFSFKITNQSTSTTHCNIFLTIRTFAVITKYAIGEFGFNTRYNPSCILKNGGVGYVVFNDTLFNDIDQLKRNWKLVNIDSETEQHFSMGLGIKPEAIRTTNGIQGITVSTTLRNRSEFELYLCRQVGGILVFNRDKHVIGYRKLHLFDPEFVKLTPNSTFQVTDKVQFFDATDSIRVFTIYNPFKCS